MEKQFYTYLHCKPDGTPFYVGKGTKNRAWDFYGRNTHHRNVVKKYGRENILVFTFSCASEEQAFKDEISQIGQLRLEGFPLTNKTDGGEGCSGCIPGEITRLKMSIVRKGKKMKPFSEEHRRKISVASKNRIVTKETREKLAEASRNRVTTQETRDKLSRINKGHAVSEETRKKMSLAKQGVVPSAYNRQKIIEAVKGIPKSDETKQKMSDSQKGKPKPKSTKCPYCTVIGDAGNMVRYHFDNCKFKPL